MPYKCTLAMTNKALTLTKTVKGDLYTLFQFQLDNEANILAAFTAKHSHSQEAYIEKYSQFLHDPTNNTQTIKVDNEIVGSIAKFIMFGDMEITYWIDKKYWG